MSQIVEITVDDAGQIVIPPVIQNLLGLTSGMILVVEAGDEEGVRLRVQSESPTLVNKNGVLVAQVQPEADLTSFIHHERNQRAFDLLQRVGL